MPSLDSKYYACNHDWQPHEYYHEQVNSKYEGAGMCLRLKSFICPDCFSTKCIDQTQDYREYGRKVD